MEKLVALWKAGLKNHVAAVRAFGGSTGADTRIPGPKSGHDGSFRKYEGVI
ncbi:hypothetical protein [Microvirga sp. M2]|uniref:hypothetical protein n=1 Tax=Microvirga sp. M2 TaxID=3073270 RepID=UPI0039C2DE87